VSRLGSRGAWISGVIRKSRKRGRATRMRSAQGQGVERRARGMAAPLEFQRFIAKLGVPIERGANLILSEDAAKLVTGGKGWRPWRMTESGHRAPVGVGIVGHSVVVRRPKVVQPPSQWPATANARFWACVVFRHCPQLGASVSFVVPIDRRGSARSRPPPNASSAPMLHQSPASYTKPPQSCLTQSDLGSLEERVQNLVAEGARHAAGGHTSARSI